MTSGAIATRRPHADAIGSRQRAAARGLSPRIDRRLCEDSRCKDRVKPEQFAGDGVAPPAAAVGQLGRVSQGMAAPKMGRSVLPLSDSVSVVTRLRPARLLAYINASARSTRSSGVSLRSAMVAPTETVTRT